MADDAPRRGRPVVKPELRLTEHITVSLTKKELKRIRMVAAKHGLSERPWVKMAVMAAVAAAEQEEDEE